MGNFSERGQLLKKWNGAHSKRLRSFHLETMAASMFTSLGSNHRTNLKTFFQEAQLWLDLADPGGHSGTLSNNLAWLTRLDVISSFEAAADRAVRAIARENAGDHAEAKRLWSIILGPDFPTI